MRDALIELLQFMGMTTIPTWLGLVIASIHVILILIGAYVLRSTLNRFLNAVNKRLMDRAPGVEERKRLATLSRIFRYTASIVIGITAGMLVLSELGISIAPFLATAGVAGIAISFGAQSLVKDYFTGFVMLIENQIRQGDFIDAAGKSGTVEVVTLRYVRLRDGEGCVHYIPNSAITTVSNYSRHFAYALIDIGVGYQENLEKVYNVIRQVGTTMREDPDLGAKILDDIEILGVNQLADSAVMVRVRVKVIAMEQWYVKRAFLGRLKEAFDAQGIEIPFPQRTLRMAGSEALPVKSNPQG